MLALIASLGAGWAFSAGCQQNIPVTSPRAFDRPESMAFFCVQEAMQAAVPLSNCTTGESGDIPEGLSLFALVTQTGKGEVAPVRVTGDRAGVLDTDVRVPGFTFVPVGEVPSALVLPENDPTFAYVASRGQSDIRIIRVQDFLAGRGARVVQPEGLLPAGSRPSAMILGPDERSLWVTLPETGQVAQVAIMGDSLMLERLIDLAIDPPEPVDLTELDPSELPPDYRVTCPRNAEVLDPPLLPPRAPVALGEAPRPWAIALDAERGWLFVADAALPMIHVIDLESGEELTPVATSGPQRDLVITPAVPATFGETEATERYLYAIDDIDGSVFVMEVTDPARPTWGAVIPVDAHQSRASDRIPLPPGARTLEVLTPGFPGTLCSESAETGPLELRGVFVSVGGADGFVRFLDVYDLDAPCRGLGECNGNATFTREDQSVFIRRHRPRIGNRIDRPISIPDGVNWVTGGTGGGGNIAVGEDGRSAEVLPRLEALECPDGLGRVFPRADAARICAVTDPWVATSEAFTVTWEGALPGTRNTGGNLDRGTPALEARVDFCAQGVLGSEDVPSEGELSAYGGDVLVITSPLLPELEDDPECRALTASTGVGTSRPVRLPILRAYGRPDDVRPSYLGRLELGPPLDVDADYQEVLRCFPELTTFEIRSREAFVVESTRGGMIHRVTRGEGGRCEIDSELELGETGRVFFGSTYRSEVVAFSLGARPAVVSRPRLSFTTGDVPFGLTVELRGSSRAGGVRPPSLPTGLQFNPVDGRLYAVEQARQGLVRIGLRPLEVQATFQ